MPSAKEEDRKLYMYWWLAVVLIVVEYGMVFDAVDKTVKCLWFNTKLVAKTFRVMNPPMIQEVEL